VEGQRGLISSIAVCADDPDMFAAGSYSGDIMLYSLNSCESIATLDGRFGGVTQLKFSPNGQYLFSGARKEGGILCWDVRNTCQVLGRFPRDSSTCQRIYFDIDPSNGRFLVTGSRDGAVRLYDLTSTPNEECVYTPSLVFQAHGTSTNGVGFHPMFSSSFPFLATASGERRFPLDCHDSSSDDDEESKQGQGEQQGGLEANCIGLWRLLLPLEEEGILYEVGEQQLVEADQSQLTSESLDQQYSEHYEQQQQQHADQEQQVALHYYEQQVKQQPLDPFGAEEEGGQIEQGGEEQQHYAPYEGEQQHYAPYEGEQQQHYADEQQQFEQFEEQPHDEKPYFPDAPQQEN